MITGEFPKYHPATNLIYFVLAFIVVFYINNPFVLVILLFISVINNIILDKGKKLRSNAIFYVFIALMIFFINPIFGAQRGAVILFYAFGNPITLESVIYGLKTALSLVTLLVTFNAFNLVINSEKFIYLFSRAAAQTAFVIMLGLRFIPTLKKRTAEITDIGRAGINFKRPRRNLKQKIQDSMNIITTLIVWSLEDAVVTAQSMRARGYGVKTNRTFYFLFKFTKRDALFIIADIIFFGLFLFSFYKYDADFKIYPEFSPQVFGSMASYGFFINLFFLVVLFALPVITEIISLIKWSFIYNADNRI